jgi:hypothetical protein
MKAGTVGECARSGCHSSSSEAKSASSTFNWLTSQGYLDGTTNPPLVTGQSCLTIYGGNMPKSGATDPQWKADTDAWAAAGAQNN